MPCGTVALLIAGCVLHINNDLIRKIFLDKTFQALLALSSRNVLFLEYRGCVIYDFFFFLQLCISVTTDNWRTFRNIRAFRHEGSTSDLLSQWHFNAHLTVSFLIVSRISPILFRCFEGGDLANSVGGLLLTKWRKEEKKRIKYFPAH